jgi:hypothetical protein
MTLNTSEIESVLIDLGAAVARDHSRRHRRRTLVLVAALATAVTASVAVAGTIDDWWTGAQPAVHDAVVSEAMHENDGVIPIDLSKKATVATTSDAQLVAVATKSGGFCLTPFHDGKMAGSSCDSTPVKDDGTASVYNTRTSYYKDDPDKQWWIGYGRVTDAGAASVDLSSVGLPADVHLDRGGFFLFDIPRDQWSQLTEQHGPMLVRNASGAVIRKGCIYTGIAPGKWYSGSGAIGGGGDTCDLQSPAALIPHPDLSKAQKLVQLTFTHDQGTLHLDAGSTLAIWDAPEAGGKTCYFTALANEQPTPAYDANGNPISGANPIGVINCAVPGDWPSGTNPIDARCGATLVGGDHYAGYCAGLVKPDSGIATLQRVGKDASTPVAGGGNAFLVELPDRPRDGKGPGAIPGGPYSIVGYDAGGHEVASTPVASP